MDIDKEIKSLAGKLSEERSKWEFMDPLDAAID